LAAVNWGEFHSRDKIACKNCNYYDIELKEIKDVIEDSLEGGIFSFMRGKRSRKIHKAFYYCPKCKAVSSYLVN